MADEKDTRPPPADDAPPPPEAGPTQSEGDSGFSSLFSQWLGSFGKPSGTAGQIYKDWERWMSEQMERMVRNEAFLGSMSKMLEGSHVFKAQMDRMMESSMKSMRMPTQGDMESVHKRLNELERRLDEVAEQLDLLVSRQRKADAGKEAP